MANYKSAPGAVGGITTVSTPTTSYWQPLIDGVEANGLSLTADVNGRKYVQNANGDQVFVVPLPNSNGQFTSGALYQTVSGIVGAVSNWNPEVTRQAEKALGLTPTGIPGNEKLIQRYLQEANKASAENMAKYVAFSSGLIKEFDQKPLGVFEQAQISIKTGTVSTGPRSSRSVSVTQFSAGQASAILEEFYNATLGRRPTAKEVKKFTSVINAQAKKQPSVSTTSYDASGNSTTVSGAQAGYTQADAQVAARQMAEADPEAAAFLNSTRYLDAFMNAIGSQV